VNVFAFCAKIQLLKEYSTIIKHSKGGFIMFTQMRRISSSFWPSQLALILIGLICLAFVSAPSSQQKFASNDGDTAIFTPHVWALEYGVADVQRAADFYTGALGFEVEENNCCAPLKVLRNGAVRLLLNRSEAKLPAADAANVHLNMRVGDLAVAAEAVRQKGGTLVDASPHPFALGQSMTIHDPFGNSINLLDIASDNKTADSKPAVFNIGVLGEKLEQIEAFYTGLGFQIFSREYLPDLPLQRHGVVALVLPGSAKSPAKSGTRQGTIVLGVSDFNAAVKSLQSRGIKISKSATTAKTAILWDPSGNQLKLMELPANLLAAANGMSKSGSTPALAQAGFERFKKLEGKWLGRSTKGWEETIHFKTIAQGSVVVENSFDAHPNETMMTMFYLDGGRLMLTHYCVARNQPRLEATVFEDEGRTIMFTFRDATNLPSRDKGHMDKAMFRFVDDDHFSSQWTWYQDGQENWMEEIKCERKP
jgi:predicted enzyme related to lactoylglutathione lyase